ncbi:MULTISPECIES: ricin-type beta-trefoil lectin domain protein [unclassified Aureimonas]|uniref:ricin-type beta-trefoil lectin domain protein n=1 Tax=unclassified Aureimonas TaxID=2615206 RepID=UPI0006FBA30B|nr:MULTISPECIES: ricin-type beta-trefoil lectin domain protein [unclassified Aureimonas]KQT69885.1 hypothetical protein ASG62_01920 [Aureimonas sp. Leaf427]KQT75961.1 hypothetical protein ASG54_14300 [Aureimonas sp. Leaf460]
MAVLLSAFLSAASLVSPASADALPPAGAAKLTFGTGGQCLASASATPANGSAATVAACASASDFTFTAVTGGYRIKTGAVCLDAGANGAAPEFWTCDGSAEQVWALSANGTGSAVKNSRFAKCIQGGTTPTLATCALTAAQSWSSPSATGTGGGTGSGTGTTSALPPATASKLTFGTGGQCLASASATPANGSAATIAACASGTSFTFTAVTGGYRIATGSVCLDGGANGTAPEFWTCDGSAEQIWALSANGTGSALKNSRFAKCIQGGTAPTLATCALTTAQAWTAYTATGTGGGTGGTGGGTGTTGALPPATASKLTFGTGGQCLGSASATPANGTAATIAACASGSDVTFTTVTGGYRIATGSVCLDAGANGTAPEFWTCDGSAEQIWTLSANGSGSGVKNSRFAKCIEGGTAPTLATCAATTAQAWSAYTATGTGGGTGGTGGGTGGGGTNPGTGGGTALPPGDAAPEGDLLLVNRRSGSCLAVPGATPAAGIALKQLTCLANAADTWRFVATAEGYQIRNVATGACAAATGTKDGSALGQQPCSTSNLAALWRLTKTDAWYRIAPLNGGGCMTPTGANDNRDVDAAIVLWTCDNADPQRWTLSAAKAVSSWGPVAKLSLVPVSAATLPSGKLLLWSADTRTSFADGNTITYTTTFDPATNTASEKLVATVGHDMFCPGISTLADGRLLIAGGQTGNRSTIYDPANDTWKAGPALNVSRGYNGMTTLSTGEAITVGGSWYGGIGGKVAEVFSPTANTWRKLANIPSERLQQPGIDPYRGDNYAWLFALADGTIFHAGPSQDMHWLRTDGQGTVVDAGRRADDVFAMNGNAVMYDTNKIAIFGGAADQTDVPGRDGVFTIDISKGYGIAPTVARRAPMAFPRAFANTTVLPSGETVTIGGQNMAREFTDERPVMIPELWSPATGQFKRLAPHAVPRNYHSWSTLLLDGRIASGGGGLCGGCDFNHPDLQILTPPYLLDAAGQAAARPAIVTATASAKAGGTLAVQTDRAVESFALVRMSSVTHSTNNDQRRVPLAIAARAGTSYQLSLPAPATGQLLAGPWMLFAMDADGVPSVAKIVRIQ